MATGEVLRVTDVDQDGATSHSTVHIVKRQVPRRLLLVQQTMLTLVQHGVVGEVGGSSRLPLGDQAYEGLPVGSLDRIVASTLLADGRRRVS